MLYVYYAVSDDGENWFDVLLGEGVEVNEKWKHVMGGINGVRFEEDGSVSKWDWRDVGEEEEWYEWVRR